MVSLELSQYAENQYAYQEKKILKKICFKKQLYLDSLPETHLHTTRKSIARRAISFSRYQHIISNYQYPQYFISTLSAIISTHSKNHSKYQQLSVPTVIISTNSKNISTLSVIISKHQQHNISNFSNYQ